MTSTNLTIYEHQIIEVQFEIDKFMAELEFHKQKSRLIKNQLEFNNTKLSHLQKARSLMVNRTTRTGEEIKVLAELIQKVDEKMEYFKNE